MDMIHSMVQVLFLAWLLVSVSFTFYPVLKRASVISDITYTKIDECTKEKSTKA